MASSGSFQRDLGGIGVPNTVTGGVVDNSASTLIETVGTAAQGAIRGFEEAKLEKNIEREIDNLSRPDEGPEFTQPFLASPGKGFGPPIEMETEAESDVKRDMGTLQQAKNSGAISFNEFNARVQALGRTAIARLPGRANTFRQIMSNTLGDHADRIEPFRTAAQAESKMQERLAKAQLDEQIEASQLNMRVEDLRAVKMENLTREGRKELNIESRSKWWADESIQLQDSMFQTTKQLQKQFGGLHLGPKEMLLAQAGIDEMGDQARKQAAAAAERGGWTRELSKVYADIDTIVKREKQDLETLSGSKFLDDTLKYEAKLAEMGLLMRNPNLHFAMQKAPHFVQQMALGSQWWADNMAALDPNNPDQQAQYERGLKIFNQKFAGINQSGLFPEGWQTGGIANSREVNKRLEGLRDVGFDIPMDKASASTLAGTPPETEVETENMLEAIRKIGDSSDGDGMAIARYADPDVAAQVNSNPEAQRIMKTQVESEISSLVSKYQLDAKIVAENGEIQKLPYGPAYDMKFADASVRAALPNSEVFVGKGLGFQPAITPRGVDENYRQGIEYIGNIVNAYPNLFEGANGQEWVRDRVNTLIGKTGSDDQQDGQATLGRFGNEVDVGKSAFDVLRDFVFPQEEREPAATGVIERSAAETTDAGTVTKEAALESLPEDFEPQTTGETTQVGISSEDITRAAPVLDLIGRKESNGNYNAHFGKANQTDIDFTDMSIDEVLAWQGQFVKQGSPSSAVGKYQIIRKTMKSLKKSLGLSGKEKFDKAMQDRMAGALLDRRGYSKFLKGDITEEQFGNNLAKEWASFPVITGAKAGRSFYAGDGLNKALTGVEDVINAIGRISSSAATEQDPDVAGLEDGQYIIDGALVLVQNGRIVG